MSAVLDVFDDICKTLAEGQAVVAWPLPETIKGAAGYTPLDTHAAGSAVHHPSALVRELFDHHLLAWRQVPDSMWWNVVLTDAGKTLAESRMGRPMSEPPPASTSDVPKDPPVVGRITRKGKSWLFIDGRSGRTIDLDRDVGTQFDLVVNVDGTLGILDREGANRDIVTQPIIDLRPIMNKRRLNFNNEMVDIKTGADIHAWRAEWRKVQDALTRALRSQKAAFATASRNGQAIQAAYMKDFHKLRHWANEHMTHRNTFEDVLRRKRLGRPLNQHSS